MRVYVHFQNGTADAVNGAADTDTSFDKYGTAWLDVTDDDGDSLLTARLSDIMYVKYDYTEDLVDD